MMMALTTIDLHVWGLVCVRFRPSSQCYWWVESTYLSHRRDAALMLYARKYPHITIAGTGDPALPIRIELRGVGPDQVRVWNPDVTRDLT